MKTTLIKYLNIVLILCLFLISTCKAVFAKEIPQNKIDEAVTRIMKEAKIPGLGLGISFPDGRVIEKGYGYANLEFQIKADKDTVFEIGSLSKTFTAIAIMMLQEEGKLSVNDKISKYFPYYPYGNEITIKTLLQHTSGIKDITHIEPFSNNQWKNWTPQEIISIIQPVPLEFEPGQKAEYSNSGCMFLGLIIEKVSGMAYNEFITARICKPLGMTKTRLGSNSMIIPNRAAGYTLSRGEIQNAEYASVSAPYASGGIISTAGDVAKLDKVFTPGVLLSEKSIKEICTPVRLNNGQEYSAPFLNTEMTYGYCLDMVKVNGKFLPAKTGGISGFNAFFIRYENPRAFVVVTANLNNSLVYLIDLAAEIGKILEEEK